MWAANQAEDAQKEAAFVLLGSDLSGQLEDALMRQEAASSIVCGYKTDRLPGRGQRIRPELPDLL